MTKEGVTAKKNGSLIKDFKVFTMRGNMIDLAVGIIIGAAFGTIIQSLVKDIIMPPIGLMLGNVDFSNLFIILKEGNVPGPYFTIDQAQKAGAVTMNIGLFINTIISFLIIAFCVFLVIRYIKKMEKKEEAKAESIRKCPFCFSTIDVHATKCPYCTSELHIDHPVN
ncbi:MAG: large conductance mechanosensitive channel protein MscL [Clostridiales bacterium]